MKGLLSENGNGNASSMRFHLILTSLGVFIILLSVAFFIIKRALGDVEPNWTEMSVFAIGMAGVLTGVGWNKTVQKKIEKKQ